MITIVFFASLVALCGYKLALSKYMKYEIEATWFLMILILNTALYTGLITHSLRIVMGVFSLIGIILLVMSFDYVKKLQVNFSHAVALFILVIFTDALMKSHLIHYDNFSHWAKIIKFLNLNLRLPGAQDTIIEFTSYPPGSALFPAYLTVLVGLKEPVMLIGQFLVIVASVLALFSGVSGSMRIQPKLIYTLSIAFTFITSKAIGFDTLLVDYLMVIMGLAVLIIVRSHRQSFRAMTLAIFLGVFNVIIVKNSAVYFVVPAVALYIYYTFRYHFAFKKLALMVLSLGASSISLLSWNQHVSKTFTSAGKHSVDAGAYQAILSEKTPEIRQQITQVFLETSLNLKTPSTLYIVIAMIILLMCAWFFVSKKQRPLKKVLLTMTGFFVYIGAYYLGIWAMFMVSMPTDEALVLAGYERYALSMALFVEIASGYVLMEWLNSYHSFRFKARYGVETKKLLMYKKNYEASVMALLIIVPMVFMAESNRLVIESKTRNMSLPQAFQASMPESLVEGARYLIVSSNDDKRIENYYLHVVSEYYLWTDNILVDDNYFNYSSEDFIALIASVDYVVVVSENISFNDHIQSLTGERLEYKTYSKNEILNKILMYK